MILGAGLPISRLWLYTQAEMSIGNPKHSPFSRRLGHLAVAVVALLGGCSSNTLGGFTGPQPIAWSPTLAQYLGPRSTSYSACYSPARTTVPQLLAQAAEYCADPSILTDTPDPANCAAGRPNRVTFRCAPQNYYSVCYNKQSATPEEIRKLVSENCADAQLIQHGPDTVNCSLANPVRVSYRCSALSRAAAEMRPNMPLTGGVDGQFRF